MHVPQAVKKSPPTAPSEELSTRLERGEDVRSEEYLAADSALAADPERALDLIFAEYVARRARGESEDRESWYRRFPQWQEELRRHFELDDLLADDPDLAPTRISTESGAPAVANGVAVRQIGRYEILGELGRGGAGLVYKARDSRLDRLAAVKVVLGGAYASPEELARFHGEATAVALLNHPNIVQVFEVGDAHGEPFLAMEYVAGGTLTEEHNQPKTPQAAAELIRTLALALHHAHQRGIIHRDLKPANILLSADGTPKIADFGLAKLQSSDGQTRTGAVLGTPSYMSPEQAAGEGARVGTPTDIYALGAILYRLVTGSAPFGDDSTIATLIKVLNVAPKRPSSLAPSIPVDLESICLKCLEKDPTRRYDSAAALAEDLGRFLEGRPVRARRSGRIERLAKWIWRRPAAAALVAVSLLGVLGVLGTTLWYNHVLNATLVTVAGLKVEAEEHNVALREHVESLQRSVYAAQLSQVQSLAKAEPTIAAELLGQADKCPPRFRDFTWRYWRRVCNRQVWQINAHAGALRSMAYSADGRLLATAGNDGHLLLWDLATGQSRCLVPGGLGGLQTVVAVPTPDGGPLRLAFAGDEGDIHLWDDDRREITRTIHVNVGPIHCLAASPDGKLLASGGADGVVRLWDLTPEGRATPWVFEGHDGSVLSLAFSPNGRELASGGADTRVFRWHVRLRTPLGEVPCNSSLPNHALAYTPNSQGLVAGREGVHPLMVWQLSKPESDRWNAFRHRTTIHGLAFFPDKRLLSGSEDGLLRIWDVGLLSEETIWRTGPLTSVAVSPRGDSYAAGEMTGLLRVLRNGGQSPSPVTEAMHQAFDGQYLNSNRLLLFPYLGKAGPRVQVWDHSTERLLWEAPANATFLGAVQDRLLFADKPGIVRSVAAATGKSELLRAFGPGERARVVAVASGTHPQVACALSDGALAITDWHTVSGRWPSELGPLTCLAYAADVGLVAAGDQAGLIRVWEVSSQRVVATLNGHKGKIQSLAFSPAGDRLASGSEDRSARLWDLPSGKVLAIQGSFRHWVSQARFSPDGQTLALASGDPYFRKMGEVRLCDPVTGDVRTTFRELTAPAVFSLSGERLMVGTAHGLIELNAESPGKVQNGVTKDPSKRTQQ